MGKPGLDLELGERTLDYELWIRYVSQFPSYSAYVRECLVLVIHSELFRGREAWYVQLTLKHFRKPIHTHPEVLALVSSLYCSCYFLVSLKLFQRKEVVF